MSEVWAGIGKVRANAFVILLQCQRVRFLQCALRSWADLNDSELTLKAFNAAATHGHRQ